MAVSPRAKLAAMPTRGPGVGLGELAGERPERAATPALPAPFEADDHFPPRPTILNFAAGSTAIRLMRP